MSEAPEMAMNIDSLIRIKADVKGENDIKRLGNSMQGVQGKVKNLKMAVGGLSTAFKALGAALAIGAFAKSAQDALQLADAVGKLSTRTGVAANTLFAYRNAAELADVSNEQLNTGLLQLSKNMLEAAKGTETYASAFRALGIAVTDESGQLRGADEVFEDIADRFAQLPDGATKAAVAMRLFGRSGAQLIPLLNGGSDALTKLGFGLSAEFTEKAQLFNDTMAGIGRRFREIQLQILDYFLPTFQMIGDAFADLFQGSSGDWKAFGALIAGVLRGVGAAVYATIAGVRFLSRVIGDLVAIADAALKRDFGKVGEIATRGLKETGAQFQTDRRNLSQLLGGGLANQRPDRTGYSRRLMGGAFDVENLLGGGAAASDKAAKEKAAADKKAAEEAAKLAEAQRKGYMASLLQLQVSQSALAVAKEADPLKRLELEFEERKRLLMVEFAEAAQSSLTTAQDMNIERKLAIDLDALAIEKQKALEEATKSSGKTFKESFGDKMEEYKKSLADFGGQAAGVVINAFQGMEDALTTFVTTGKANFRDLANSIIADITRIAIRQAIIKPLVGALFPDVKNANGNVFAANGIVPFAKGGIVDRPMVFPFARGGIGLMGEAGPEAIMPLKRGPGGRLGVEASGGGQGVVVNVNVDAQGTSVQGDQSRAGNLGRAIAEAVRNEIVVQKRPGGLLS
jgi:lambda family phage tail tape measure protein